MRGKRSKQYRKLMHQYSLHFNFREPYQVLVDASMVQDTARFHMDLATSLERTLHGKIKPMITQCSIRHLYVATSEDPSQKSRWIETAKSFERRRCDHHTLEEPLSTLECLTSVTDPKGSKTNKNRYVVASQDVEVRAHMRTIPGVPLIYVKRSVMVMEPMAGATEEVREREEKGKRKVGLRNMRGATTQMKRKREDDDENEGRADGEAVELAVGANGITAASVSGHMRASATQEPAPKKRKRGTKGPNPLSVKKPKKRRTAELVDEDRATKMAVEMDALATEKGLDADAANLVADGDSDAQAKRKRKRRHKTATASTAADVVPDAHEIATDA
ncbi:hypothetical protein LTR66_000225 [Elasticomyces elasticus]|nr:hypothetical protein LTR66_000225 [Elasticomyces elasticus]